MKKKICMLVHTHSFLDSRIFKKEAKSLQRNGYDVTMIVPRIKGTLFDVDKKPFDKKFSATIFKHEGIKIVTYNLETFKPSASEMNKNLVKNNDSLFNNPLTKLGIEENADIYHAHELASLYAGIGIKRMLNNKGNKNIKLIFDSHDLIPDPLDNRILTPTNKAEMLKLLETMIEEIDQLITVSHSIKSWYIAKNPLLPTEIIYNSPPLTQNYVQRNYDQSRLTVCYEGHIADNRKGSRDKIFKLTELCSKKIDFNFKIIGGVLHGHKLSIPDHLEENIELTGWVDYHAIANHMKDVDIGWIDFDDLQNSLNRSYALPNKFFSYLNNGIPVVVNKCHEMENFIKTHNCGLVINKVKATAEDYAEAFLYLNKNREKLKTMSINARKVMERLYSWDEMEKDLLKIYNSLLVGSINKFNF
ncbi:glycosyltransferase [Priestia megaterium]|uniref:glycosyltransferase n=1 Tax=Priestia megaterium TaxID=1404 RepID=UPI00138F89A9|nr:glycosyltransferase [Priestia megaterium]MCF8890912.1 glycosyltransferase [Priestia megaterium]